MLKTQYTHSDVTNIDGLMGMHWRISFHIGSCGRQTWLSSIELWEPSQEIMPQLDRTSIPGDPRNRWRSLKREPNDVFRRRMVSRRSLKLLATGTCAPTGATHPRLGRHPSPFPGYSATPSFLQWRVQPQSAIPLSIPFKTFPPVVSVDSRCQARLPTCLTLLSTAGASCKKRSVSSTSHGNETPGVGYWWMYQGEIWLTAVGHLSPWTMKFDEPSMIWLQHDFRQKLSQDFLTSATRRSNCPWDLCGVQWVLHWHWVLASKVAGATSMWSLEPKNQDLQ